MNKFCRPFKRVNRPGINLILNFPKSMENLEIMEQHGIPQEIGFPER